MIDIHNKIFLGNCFGNPIIEAVGKKMVHEQRHRQFSKFLFFAG